MIEKIEGFIKDLISGLQMARLYSTGHPQFQKAIDKTYHSLREALAGREELIIGIVGEELAFEKEIFFDLSKMLKPMIVYLKERGIERIVFYGPVKVEELSKFIVFLLTPKGQIKNTPEESLSILGIKNIVIGKLKGEGGAVKDKLQDSLNYFNLFETSLNKITNSMESVLEGGEVDSLALRVDMSSIMENLLGRYQEFLNFGTLKRYDSRTFFHTLNVSILSMYFASKLGFAKEQVLDIGIAGLFHDIGKISISRKIIQKPGKLTDDEFVKMKSHVVIGAEILLKYVDDLGILPAIICFEHHLKYDISGYPKLAFPQKPHITSLLVAICDVYDALSQRRSYKNDYPPEMIYDIMKKERGTTFESGLLDKFFRITGVWPVGAIVLLSDGRVAVVREENEDDIFSPRVDVIAPADRREAIDLKAQSGKIKIEHSLNPLTQGKQYLPLINVIFGNNSASAGGSSGA